jgi:hypothetical protein
MAFIHLVFALFVGAALLEGWVLSVMWRWFIVPLGAPVISIPAAIGIALLAGMLTHQTRNPDEVEWEHLLSSALIAPPFILLVGWVVKQFL